MMPLTPFLAQKVDECQQKYDLGTSTSELIEALHDQGLSLNEVCSVIASVLGIDPVEAHVFVADNPVWVEVVDLTSPVIKEVMQVLDRDGEIEVMDDGVVVFREQLAGEALAEAIAPTSPASPSA